MVALNNILIISIVLVSAGIIIYGLRTEELNATTISTLILIPITLTTAYFAYYTKEVDERRLAFETSDRTNFLYDQMNYYHPYSANFYNEINPDSSKEYKYEPSTPEEKNKYEMINHNLSTILIEMVSEFFHVSEILAKDSFESWILTFRTWFKSVIVRDEWERSKNLYGKGMIDFIDNEILSKLSKENVNNEKEEMVNLL